MTLARGYEAPTELHEDQLHLLALSLELQLDLLLVALPPDDGTPVELDLTGAEPVTQGRRADWPAERYTALEQTIDEMLDHPEVRRHPAVVSRLLEARASCARRLAGLPPDHGQPPEPGLPRRSGAVTVPTGAGATGLGESAVRIEAGHFLG